MTVLKMIFDRSWAGMALRSWNRALLPAVCLLLASPVQAVTFDLNASADAFVTTGPGGSLSSSNYGGAGALSIAAPGSTKGEFQTVLKFDLGPARTSFDTQFGAGQWNLQSVKLTLAASAPLNPIFNSSAAGQFAVNWMQNDSWVEGTGGPAAPSATGINFTTLQSSFIGGSDEGLGTFSYNGSTTGTASYTLNLASGFASDVTAGNNVSFRLFAADATVSYLFNSRNFPDATLRPMLSIEALAVPEPGYTAFVFLVMAILYGRRRIAIARSNTPYPF
jgi:hypothetical protein